MAAIDQYLRQILEATYGEEVRHSIHDAIKQNYMDVSDSVAQANQAADAAEEALAKANQATANVNAVVDRANEASSTANAASSTANSASERATSAATRVETIEQKYTNATAQASSLAPGATPTATLEDGPNGKIFKFGIPKGEKGNTGATPQMSIGTVAKGDAAGATITGTAEAPVLNLTLPKGDTGATPQLSIGNVTKGENAGATITGTAEAPVLNLTLPKGDTGGKGDKGQKGDTGATPQLSIGTVTKSSTAGATITGTAEAPVLNLNLPKGDTGATPQLGVGTVETGLPGSKVEVTISGTAEAPNLNFKIPKGDTGVAENIYGNTVQMSEQDSTTVAAAIGAKANASETYTKTQVDTMIAGATDADAVHSVNGETATNHAVTVNADKIKMSASEDVTIPNKLKQYVKTVNGTAPDPITGNVTVATGGGDSTVGLIRRIIGIPVSEWAGSGPYTYTYPDDDIKVGMVVLEEYLADEYAQLGINTYTVQNGSLTIATTVKPTANWSLDITLGMDGSSILDDVGALQTKVGTSPLTTTAQNLSDAVNELDDDLSHQSQQIEKLPAVIVSVTVDVNGASMSEEDQAKLTADMIMCWYTGNTIILNTDLAIRPGNGSAAITGTASSSTTFRVAFIHSANNSSVASVIKHQIDTPNYTVNENGMAHLTLRIFTIPDQNSFGEVLNYIITNEIDTKNRYITLDIMFTYRGNQHLTGYLYPDKTYGAGLITKYDGNLMFWALNQNNITVYNVTKTSV